MDLRHITPNFDGDTDYIPKKRFEPDFGDNDCIPKTSPWTPTAEEYELYERSLWHEEFRKLLELDDNSLKNDGIVPPTTDKDHSSWSSLSPNDSQYHSDMDDNDNDNGDYNDVNEVEPMRPETVSNVERICHTRKIEHHPLMIPEIIQHILSYLDYHHDKETLDNCQLVCKRWKEVCSKRMDQSDESFSISTKLLSDLKLEDEIKKVPKHCHIFNIKLPGIQDSTMDKVFETLGHRIKELDICFNVKDNQSSGGGGLNNNNPNIDHFGDCLEQYCPRLEKLKLWLSATNHYPEHIFSHEEQQHFLPLKEIETEDFFDDRKMHIFEELISASPLLETLSFQHEKTELIVNVLHIVARDRHRLRTLKSLEIFQYDITEEFITFVLKYRWNLQHLRISFSKEVSIMKIRSLLHHLKETLTSLVLLYKGPDYDPSLPIEDNWVIPLTLKKLKSLEISPNIFSNSCRFLVNALQLSNLKSCKISSTISWSENYFDAMWSRNRLLRRGGGGGSGGGRKGYHHHEPSLEIFEIPCSCMDASIFLQQPNPFQNLKELVLDSPSIKVLQAVFLAQTNLERLKIFELYSLSNYSWYDLNYFDDLRGRPLIWDEVLTGCKKPEYTMMYKMKAEPLMEAAPSIRNLTKLKFLLLDFKSSHEKISDFFIYHGLMYLRQLQHIDINRHSFTEDAIKDLREQLLKFCYLELGSDSDDDDEDVCQIPTLTGEYLNHN